MLTRILCLATSSLLIAGMPCCLGQAVPRQDSPTTPATAAPSTSVSPVEIHWTLAKLDGEPIGPVSGEVQPYIYLQAQGDKLSGSGGCNRFFGSFDLSGSSLQFHSVARTEMACPGNSMEYDSRLLEALKQTTSFQLNGKVFTLRADDRVLAEFSAGEKD